MSNTVPNSNTSTIPPESQITKAGDTLHEMAYALGLKANHLGDVITKLGDKLMGDEPEGVAEAWDRGYARGRDKGIRDMVAVLAKAYGAKA